MARFPGSPFGHAPYSTGSTPLLHIQQLKLCGIRSRRCPSPPPRQAALGLHRPVQPRSTAAMVADRSALSSRSQARSAYSHTAISPCTRSCPVSPVGRHASRFQQPLHAAQGRHTDQQRRERGSVRSAAISAMMPARCALQRVEPVHQHVEQPLARARSRARRARPAPPASAIHPEPSSAAAVPGNRARTRGRFGARHPAPPRPSSPRPSRAPPPARTRAVTTAPVEQSGIVHDQPPSSRERSVAAAIALDISAGQAGSISTASARSVVPAGAGHRHAQVAASSGLAASSAPEPATVPGPTAAPARAGSPARSPPAPSPRPAGTHRPVRRRRRR